MCIMPEPKAVQHFKLQSVMVVTKQEKTNKQGFLKFPWQQWEAELLVWEQDPDAIFLLRLTLTCTLKKKNLLPWYLYYLGTCNLKKRPPRHLCFIQHISKMDICILLEFIDVKCRYVFTLKKRLLVMNKRIRVRINHLLTRGNLKLI